MINFDKLIEIIDFEFGPAICPCCGGKLEVREENGIYYFVHEEGCRTCGKAELFSSDDKDQLVFFWNMLVYYLIDYGDDKVKSKYLSRSLYETALSIVQELTDEDRKMVFRFIQERYLS